MKGFFLLATCKKMLWYNFFVDFHALVLVAVFQMVVNSIYSKITAIHAVYKNYPSKFGTPIA